MNPPLGGRGGGCTSDDELDIVAKIFHATTVSVFCPFFKQNFTE